MRGGEFGGEMRPGKPGGARPSGNLWAIDRSLDLTLRTGSGTGQRSHPSIHPSIYLGSVSDVLGLACVCLEDYQVAFPVGNMPTS